MFIGPVGQVGVLQPEAILGNFYWPEVSGYLIASSPSELHCEVSAQKTTCKGQVRVLFPTAIFCQIHLLLAMGQVVIDST